MKNLYTYRVAWSEADQAYVAKCLEFPSLGAHGETREEAAKQIALVVSDVIDELIAAGEPVPEPFRDRKSHRDGGSPTKA